MIANYHTHTPLCRHAKGSVMEYAQAACDAGLTILGFSDHTPYCFPEGYYSHMRMYPDQLSGYVREVLEAREAFRGRLEIPLGLEVEYYPKYFRDTLSMVRDAGIEYFLLGQHWCGNEMDAPYNGSPTDREEDLTRYCRQVMEAMQTGLFTYLAHPDLIHFVGNEKVYRRHMGQLCREAKSCGIPLEINLLGLATDRQYPNPHFWEVVAEESCPVVIGVDAHAPTAFGDSATEARAMEMVNRLDLKLLETLPLRPIL